MIIDANVLGTFLGDPEDEDCMPIYRWMKNGGKIIYSSGGKFDNETSSSAKGKLFELTGKGSAIFVRAERFASIEANVEARGYCKSNDFHILALAKFTGTRVLYTRDKNLIQDFKNKDVVAGPRGRIYSGKANASLLNRATCRRN